MVKHTQTICRQQPTNCLSVFDHVMELALKELTIDHFEKTHTRFPIFELNLRLKKPSYNMINPKNAT